MSQSTAASSRREGLDKVLAMISRAAKNSGRNASEIELVVASKTQSTERILPLLQAGHRVFGENRVQEAEDKWPLHQKEYPDLKLHMIGPLQSNKAENAVKLFDVIETLDRLSLAKALKKAMVKLNRYPQLYVEINTGDEPQKAGILPSEADSFLRMCTQDYGLQIEGLMCIPPASQLPSPHFMFLSQIAARNRIKKLSMGMSADFPQAIECGATHVRVGTAVFSGRI